MSRSTLSALLAVALASKFAFAQPDPADPTPLVDKTYAYPSGIPYQVDYNTAAIRGPQVGYNICNSTTENQNSMCQTSMVNHIDDFCLWAPPLPNSTIGDTEQEEVAWCTKPGHGTRLIPQGALQGVQLLKTSAYIQITGYLDQVQVNMAADDYGGELDPHGADLRGNPLGGLMYSNAFPSNGGNNNSYQQVIDWTNFMGGNAFCITICDPATSASDQSAYCQNIYDRMGCSYNMPSNAPSGLFEVCDADLKTPAGVYVTNGVTMTYSQPASGDVTPPYTPVVPASSNCVTYQSAALYTSLPTATLAPATTSGVPGVSHSGTVSGSSTSSGAPASSTSNGAMTVGVSSVAGILGTLFAVAFLS
ncbi:hypothetical protein PAXINDRAFT_170792 [Paxillus involutus ATCC 200175]|uniref:Macrofage activating glycoprotein n=1 Tax=Paxillus involutus ATCC 200175 TaxID=664439 RepID=A0A0C9SV92_PAXIN|nr:hypothetical protein PAXINDRAFT_170792 [Paxillus involutus ATCC 200175]